MNPEQGNEQVSNREQNKEVMCASASQTLPADLPDVPFDDVLFDEARSMGSEPNVEITIEAPAPAPQKRKAAPRRKPPLHARSTPMPLSPMSTRPSLRRSALGTLSRSSPLSSITQSHTIEA